MLVLDATKFIYDGKCGPVAQLSDFLLSLRRILGRIVSRDEMMSGQVPMPKWPAAELRSCF